MLPFLENKGSQSFFQFRKLSVTLLLKRQHILLHFSTNDLVTVHKVPLASLRLPPKYSFTKSKLRFWRLRKPCNWHFLNRHNGFYKGCLVYRHPRLSEERGWTKSKYQIKNFQFNERTATITLRLIPLLTL
jgi:hypothetical protein